MGETDNSAAKACHNCRRRRWKCDRTLPVCLKCERHGQECWGYGKLFLWNQGVASRGKMMGKTFSAPQPDKDPLDDQRRSAELVRADARAYGDISFVLPPTLPDPLYQSLDGSSRQYLFHFSQNLSGDMAICDITDANPFCGLIPLCQGNAVLLHAISANAALHVSCLHRRGVDMQETAGSTLPASSTDLSSRAMVDALSAKHKTLVLLRRALEDLPNFDVDVLVATAHLFIIFELISPGGDEWRAHVQGAMRLISYLQRFQSKHTSSVALIRDAITSDCLTYYVLGRTLMNTSTSKPDPFVFNNDIIASLTRAETNSYLSLPTPLLQTLFKACELSNLVSAATEAGSADLASLLTQANALILETDSFDVNAWASSLEGTFDSSRTQSRIHTALAHQNALKIYICRSVDQISPVLEDTEALVTNIINHLSAVGVSDPIFKATSWPTFIAGAEANNQVYRNWAVERLHEFWDLMPWGYVKTAVEVMRTTWELRDSDQDGKGGWIQQLKGLERYWLIA